jgi:hypothetical protein
MNLYQKIVKVMQMVGKLEKDGEIKKKNGDLLYRYLSEEMTTSTLQRAFVEWGLVMIPVEMEDDFFYVEGEEYGKPFKVPVTRIKVTYKIVDSDTGQFETMKTIGYGTDSGDKGANKAMTNALKYAERQTFMIASGEDDPDHVGTKELTERFGKGAQQNQQQGQQERRQERTRSSAPPTGRQDGPRMAQPGQVKAARQRIERNAMPNEVVIDMLKRAFGKGRIRELTSEQCSKFIDYIDAWDPPRQSYSRAPAAGEYVDINSSMNPF